MKKAGIVVAWIVGLYLAARAAVEPFVIDMSDPESYSGGWGGPSLAGVLLVHMGPGVASAALMVAALIRRRRRRDATEPASE